MKVELKKLQIVNRLSQETICFAADVFVNGRKAGTAENAGHGGNTTVWFMDKAVAASVDAHAKSLLPAEMKEYKFLNPTEWLIDDLVHKHFEAKELLRVAKRVAKVDADYRASCPQRGTHAARFNVESAGGRETRWVEFRDEASARAAAEKKHGAIQNWTVIA